MRRFRAYLGSPSVAADIDLNLKNSTSADMRANGASLEARRYSKLRYSVPELCFTLSFILRPADRSQTPTFRLSSVMDYILVSVSNGTMDDCHGQLETSMFLFQVQSGLCCSVLQYRYRPTLPGYRAHTYQARPTVLLANTFPRQCK